MKISYAFIFVLLSGSIFFGSALFSGEKNSQRQASEISSGAHIAQQEITGPFPEIEEFRMKSLVGFDEISAYFKELAERKGAAYAFAVLREAPMPPNTDMHLMGHVVGDVLYKQQGMDGIVVCTQDFRNACSHSVVVGALLKIGEEALPEVRSACQKAPGGKGAYTMCYHGFGHGVLAYFGYDMGKAVAFCERTGTKEYGYQEAGQCIGGAVMELIGGGFHDPVQWRKQRPKYLDPQHPLELCSASRIPEVGKWLCVNYITPYLFEAAGGDAGNPTPDVFARAFRYCEDLLPQDLAGRSACYGGFGKEFIVLVQDRDIRRVEDMTDAQMRKAISFCALANNVDGVRFCLDAAQSSLFWGGENDPRGAIRFCSLTNAADQEACFDGIIGNTLAYVVDVRRRQDICAAFPNAFQEKCRSRLGV